MNREDAKVPDDVIDKSYWICKQRRGSFPEKLRQFKEERIRQKQLEMKKSSLVSRYLLTGAMVCLAILHSNMRTFGLLNSLLPLEDILCNR